jgi:hypothetical protein
LPGHGARAACTDAAFFMKMSPQRAQTGHGTAQTLLRFGRGSGCGL